MVKISSRKANVLRNVFNMYQSKVFMRSCKVRIENGKESVKGSLVSGRPPDAVTGCCQHHFNFRSQITILTISGSFLFGTFSRPSTAVKAASLSSIKAKHDYFRRCRKG